MAATIATEAPVSAAKPWYRVLYVQVLIAIVLGALLGWLWPDLRPTTDQAARRRLHQADQDGDRADDLLHRGLRHRAYTRSKKVGRIGGKALVYFEVVSTFALVIGLVVGNLVRPGAGFGGNIEPAGRRRLRHPGRGAKGADHLMHIIPDTFFGAFAQGEILQVLLIAILFGFA